jgi:2-polyprenyl-3-methyl-5-hydroxy-6-metoxy-1,4-benzoquinol methylase
MHRLPSSSPAPVPVPAQTPSPTLCAEPRLRATQQAFDSVAADYDGPRGNNALIQDMRGEMWRWLDASFAPGSRLIDIGCGTGLDAIRMARIGHRVTATDWSPQMIRRTEDRAAREQLQQRVQALALGAQELRGLDGEGGFHGAYSNLGPLNCVPDLAELSRQCARLVMPGGALVFSVIGRVCPWEIAHYLRRGRWARVRLRFAREFVPVSMNGHTIWTHYYRPREFYRAFQREFVLSHVRGLCLFAPPPYLTWVRERHPRGYQWLRRLDRRYAGWPLLRGMGDHFLIVMRRR